ncbi:hypothetical protein [Salinivibrio socompensis]|uniref:hypothetical protein n=1 Tax=Salinivibrio socompensis TaxID=1510206 RepID=UPI000472C80A|nr:hypothetical protein [Salinivibrio socompensis]
MLRQPMVDLPFPPSRLAGRFFARSMKARFTSLILFDLATFCQREQEVAQLGNFLLGADKKLVSVYLKLLKINK